ncbi:MAG: hypothetical protein K2W95_36300 [Candidatus Obscuribacterales bacterium]|nr:hypothetical protein [Candidatus Obscuribacterales bacterium]
MKPICFSKAGEGVIHEDLYLSLDTKKNEIHTQHKSWRGLPATKSQTVFVVDGAVLEQLPADARWEQVTLVVFTPKVIQFIDYSRNDAGIYFRRPE